MDPERARRVAALLGEHLGDEVLLWRGAEMRGSDIDLVVAAGAQPQLTAALGAAGLRRLDGERLWRSRDGNVVVDPITDRQWPRRYPQLQQVWGRASRPAGLPLVAAPADRLLIYAADAAAGRPVSKLAAKARQLLGEQSARQALMALADSLGERALAELIADPDALLATQVRGRLPYGRALRVASRSSLARAAAATRAHEAVRARLGGLPARRALRRRARRGVLVALSGMDGAGKSSAAVAVKQRLDFFGFDTVVEWHRLGESRTLSRIGPPLKQLLRRSVTIADPIASRSPTETIKRQDPRVAAGRHSAMSWTWVMIVTAFTVASHRRAARLAGAGRAVVCDRFACDSLVDVEVRYGAHRGARWLLRRLAPRPDLAVVLEIDAETAAQRKPEDQAPAILRRMQSLYARAAEQVGAQRIDATRRHELVLAEIMDCLDSIVRQRLEPIVGERE